MDMEFTIDVKQLIEAVQQRPCIWDIDDNDYTDKEIKKRSWEEIVNIFIPKKDATLTEKREFGLQLHRRWKSLRDSFARELRTQKKIKSQGGQRKRPVYVYFNRLSFLEKSVVTQPFTNSSKTDDDQNLETTSPNGRSPPQKSTKPASKRKKLDPVPAGEKLVIAAENNVQTRQEREGDVENDSDRLFLLSLVDPLKRIPQYARFGVKRKLMDCLDRELQFYGLAIATDALHYHSSATDSSNNPLSPVDLLSPPALNETEMEFTLEDEQLNFKVESLSPSYSNSSANTDPLSDNE
ncbi:uncharacterized protein LOC114334191 [Diabrotica virgifera virgifera]|uniref:Transcription factor Adf-1-like n=1 Tax=Diabrotica virgifera virgifera TaxID=50390 RepID=A0ABM5IRU0_DIAVI|nr:uncharacterized protein LOC114334191 [Diabrotica virgifera virgifera]